MTIDLEKSINDCLYALEEWEYTARRTPLNDDTGCEKWNLEECEKLFGTYIDSEGAKQICQTRAEKCMAKLIDSASKLAKDHRQLIDDANWKKREVLAQLERLEKFASMSDRELGEHFESHLRDLKQDEGEEDLIYIPDFYWYIARRLK